MKPLEQFLNYTTTHTNSMIRYYKYEIILNRNLDAQYLTEEKVQSIIGDHYFLVILPRKTYEINNNGEIHTMCSILKHVVASKSESYLGGLFNTKRIGEII